MRFSDMLRADASDVWTRVLAHPFVQGIGDGTLNPKYFCYYLQQDYVFLIDYCRVIALAAAKCSNLDAMTRFGALLHATLHIEMAMHRTYAGTFGVSEDDLSGTRPSPTTFAYTRHLLAVGYQGSLLEAAAALLPCHWGYWEIGQYLARSCDSASRSPYGDWIREYSSREYGELAEWARGFVDSLADEAAGAERARATEAYRSSARYEQLFWEAAMNLEAWPE